MLKSDMFRSRIGEIIGRWSPLALRLIVGFGFMVHGWAKLSRGPDKFARVVEWIGFPMPHFFAWLTTIAELVTGFAMFIGAFVTLMTIPMLTILLVAMFSVHLQYGFFMNWYGQQPGEGFEYHLLAIGLAIIVMIRGGGYFSLDRKISLK